MYQSATIHPDTYYDPDIPVTFSEDVDMYLVRFSQSHVLEWHTYFGGEAGPSYESIYTLLHRNGDLYAAGFTTKSLLHWVGPYYESFFPLHDPQVPGVHFVENYGDTPSAGGLPTADAFITRFCASALTSVHDPVQTREESLRTWQVGDQLFIAGLPAGTYNVSVTDASGRIVTMDRTTSDGSRATMTIGPVSEGVYVLHFPDIRRYARLFISR